jgi:hypothetical protein
MHQEGTVDSRLEKLRTLRHFFPVLNVHACFRRLVTSQGITPKHYGVDVHLALCSQKTDDWIEIVFKAKRLMATLNLGLQQHW